MLKVFMCRVSKRLKARVGTDIVNYFQESNSPLHLESRTPQYALGIFMTKAKNVTDLPDIL